MYKLKVGDKVLYKKHKAGCSDIKVWDKFTNKVYTISDFCECCPNNREIRLKELGNGYYTDEKGVIFIHNLGKLAKILY